MDFTLPVDHKVKMKESEKIDRYLTLTRDLKKVVEHKGDGDNYCGYYAWNSVWKVGCKM